MDQLKKVSVDGQRGLFVKCGHTITLIITPFGLESVAIGLPTGLISRIHFITVKSSNFVGLVFLNLCLGWRVALDEGLSVSVVKAPNPFLLPGS